MFIATDDIDVFPGNHGIELSIALVLLTSRRCSATSPATRSAEPSARRSSKRDGRILKKKYFDQTEAFFEKHGNKALVIGRFVPFVRTYVTVVAGVTRLDRRRFLLWSFVGAVVWVLSITLLGYFLGTRVPWLRDNIDYAILAILALSVIPIAYEWIRHRRNGRKRAAAVQRRGEPRSPPRADQPTSPGPRRARPW